MSKEEYLKLDNQLCFVLYASSRAVTKLYRPLLDSLGLTYPQYLVMLVLWEHQVQKVTDIGEKLHLDTGTLTPLLKRLEAAGLVLRERDPDDERKVRVTLTRQGDALKKKALKVPEDLYCRSGMTAEEFYRLKTELTGLLDQLESFDADDEACR